MISALFLESVAHSLDGHDMLVADLAAQTTDMHIDCAVANNHLLTPDFSIDFLTRKESFGLGVEQVEQRKFLAWEHRFVTVANDRMALSADLDFGRCSGHFDTSHYGVNSTL